MNVKKSLWPIISALAISFFVLSCETDSTPEPADVSNSPRLTTLTVTDITSVSASGGGDISNVVGTSVSARGVVWSTSNNPTIALSTKTADGIGAGLFTSSLSELEPSTTYFVRAYATSSVGTAYGTEVTFITATDLPTLTTTLVRSISSSSISSGGTIINDGGFPIEVRGVVWGTSANPTISLSTKTTNGTGTGSFTSTIAGLAPGVPYFIRAYATTSKGTSYGSTVRWKFSRSG